MVQQTLHLSARDHTVTDNIITISPCTPFLTVTKKLYYNQFIFPPRAVCCQIARRPHPQSETSNSFASTTTVAAATSGIKCGQGDYTAAYYWLNSPAVIMSMSKQNPRYRRKPHQRLGIIDIFVLLGEGVDSYKCQSLSFPPSV